MKKNRVLVIDGTDFILGVTGYIFEDGKQKEKVVIPRTDDIENYIIQSLDKYENNFTGIITQGPIPISRDLLRRIEERNVEFQMR